jgi:hypothetical protein
MGINILLWSLWCSHIITTINDTAFAVVIQVDYGKKVL